MSSLLRSIQYCVQGVPVGQMAQGTPPSAHAAAFQGGFNRLDQLLHGFFTKSQVKSFQIIFRLLHQLLNLSQGDVPMALLPDPTKAASERSSVKNRLKGSRRRASGINRHRSGTVSKTSLRGRHRVQAHPGKGAGPEPLQPAVKHAKIRQTFRSCLSSLTRSCIQDCVQEVPVKQVAQGTPPLGARRGLPRWLQPASSTSPWLFFQVSSEVFSKSSSVMSSLLFL